MRWWVLILAAFFLPILAAPALASALEWPLQSTITRMIIVGCGTVVLCWHGFPSRTDVLRVVQKTHLRALSVALGAAAAACIAYSLGLVLLGAESPRPFAAIHRPDRLLSGLGIGLLVSSIEEPVFRKLLLHRLSFGGRALVGVGLSSLLYALAHYLRPDRVPPKPVYSIGDSLAVYEDMLGNLTLPITDPSPGLGLFLFGVFLCFVARHRGLPWTIGIHASAVYYQKADSCLVYWNHHGRHPLFGTFEVKYDGALFWIVCTGTLLALAGLWGFSTRTPAGTEPRSPGGTESGPVASVPGE